MSKLSELIWYELGDGLMANDVKEAERAIKDLFLQLISETECNCDEPQLGYIDGDYQYLYCAVCKLVLGDLADIMIRKELETA